MPRRPHRASPDEVRITRDGDYAIIEYADPKVATTHYRLGQEKLSVMTDSEILAHWNEHIDARDAFMAAHEHVCVEIPMGRPQLQYEDRSDQWVPRGDVVKGLILDASGNEDLNEPFVIIHGHDLSIREFVRMVGTNGGWGFRLTFVPDEDIHGEPPIDVREPREEGS